MSCCRQYLTMVWAGNGWAKSMIGVDDMSGGEGRGLGVEPKGKEGQEVYKKHSLHPLVSNSGGAITGVYAGCSWSLKIDEIMQGRCHSLLPASPSTWHFLCSSL